ncbi:MAG: hypothetical protein ACR2QG_02425 [Gammaproteobacteria bacterium]
MIVLWSVSATTAELESFKVKRKKGTIDIRAEITVNAPSPEVYLALLEFDKFDELSDTFTDSRYIEPAEDGSPRIYTRIDGCILFFCKTIERYAHLGLYPSWKVTATAEPELSDAEMSIESWTLSDNGDTTVIDYEHSLRPGFWVPPLIGTLVIRRSIKKSALEAGVRIEELALANMAAKADQTSPESL